MSDTVAGSVLLGEREMDPTILGSAMGIQKSNGELQITNTIKDDKTAYDQYEKFNLVANDHKTRLMVLLRREQRSIEFNEYKIMNKWRKFMRDAKTAELKQQIQIIAQNHDRKSDRKDTQVKVLAADIDGLEENFQDAQRSHIRKLDTLREIHQSRIVALCKNFEKDLLTLKNEFDEERKYVVTKQAFGMQQMKALIAEVNHRENACSRDAKQAHETEREEIRNKNLEEINILKISLEAKIEEYEKQFDQAHDRYIQNTVDKNRDFSDLKVNDEELGDDIDALLKQIHGLKEGLASWKKKIMQNDRECRERNMILRKERNEISRNYRSLKAQMTKFRRNEDETLGHITVFARSATASNTTQLQMCKRILTMSEVALKFETRSEQILPFKICLEADIAGDKISDPLVEKRIQEDNHMAEFKKKFNKALVRKLRIEKLRHQLLKKYKTLRASGTNGRDDAHFV